MKRIFVVLFVFCMFLMSAFSEEIPDGVLFDAYRVQCENETIDGYSRIFYIDSEGLLFSAYGNDTDISVSVEVNETADDAEGFLSVYKQNLSKYAKVLSEADLGAWENPTENEGRGIRIRYMHERAASEEDAFVTDVFASKLSEGKFLVCTFACAVSRSEKLNLSENEFFGSFDLEKVRVSKVFMAYLKNARENDGSIFLSVDYCSVEYDASIFTVYSVNPTKTEHEYVLDNRALIWTPVIDEALYSVRQTEADAGTILEIIENYRKLKNSDAIYRILFNEENEIIWMMHYNAF